MLANLDIVQSNEPQSHGGEHGQEDETDDEDTQELDVDADVAAEREAGRPLGVFIVPVPDGVARLQCVCVCCWR